jgi:hypothetical protein
MFVTVCVIHSIMSSDTVRCILCSKLTSNLRMDLMLRIVSADVNHLVLESEFNGEKRKNLVSSSCSNVSTYVLV